MSKKHSRSSIQLPFLFHLHEKQTFDNFYPGPNTIVLSSLKQLVTQKDLINTVYLWGHAFVGCTHLLKACVKAFEQEGLKALYLSLESVQKKYKPSDLIDLMQELDCLCFDDIESANASIEWQKALFTLYNQLLKKRIPMIVAAHHVPNQLPFILKDLTSRLGSGWLFQVHELNDQEKVAALQLRAHLRGLELTEGVAQFLLSRLPRSAKTLVDALNQLDRFVSAQQRKLTMPFVKEILKI